MGKRKGINGKQTVFIQGWFLYGKCINFNNCSPSKAPVKSLTRILFCLQLTEGMAQVNYPQSFCSTMFWEVSLKLSHCSCGKHIFWLQMGWTLLHLNLMVFSHTLQLQINQNQLCAEKLALMRLVNVSLWCYKLWWDTKIEAKCTIIW